MAERQTETQKLRPITLIHNGSVESVQAVIELLTKRTGRDKIDIIDTRELNVSGPDYAYVPCVIGPGGLHEKLEGVRHYIQNADYYQDQLR